MSKSGRSDSPCDFVQCRAPDDNQGNEQQKQIARIIEQVIQGIHVELLRLRFTSLCRSPRGFAARERMKNEITRGASPPCSVQPMPDGRGKNSGCCAPMLMKNLFD